MKHLENKDVYKNSFFKLLTGPAICLLIGLALFTSVVNANPSKQHRPIAPTPPAPALPSITAKVASKYAEPTTLIQTEDPEAVVAAARTRGIAVREVIRPADAPAIVKLSAVTNAHGLSQLTAELPEAKATPNHRYQVVSHFTPDDTHYGEQWNLPKIKAPEGWDTATGSSDVVLAIIDTGVLFEQTISGITYAQPDFPASRRWANTGEAGELATNGIDDDGNGYVDDAYGWDFMGGFSGDADCPNHDPNQAADTYIASDNNPQPYSCDSPTYPTELNKTHFDGSCVAFESACYVGHGTVVGSTAAAQTNNAAVIAGIDHNAAIMNLRVLDGYGFTTTDRVAEAVRYATANGADVINLSLAVSDCSEEFTDPVLEDALVDAKAAGIVIAAAAGNENSGIVCYPASSTSAIAVGATDQNDERASFSNTGSALDVVAPGVGVPAATAPSSANGDALYNAGASGTSLATPHVAGLASLLKAFAPGATTDQMYSFITGGADKVAGMDGKNRTDSYGYGRINTAKSLDLAINYSWQLESQAVYSDQARTQKFTNTITLAPGNKAYIRVKGRNTGNQTWDQSFLRLGTSKPRDRQSAFEDTSWIVSTRPTELMEATVEPGGVGTFEFILAAPLKTGGYKECFNLVAEARRWLRGKDACYPINVVEPATPQNSHNFTMTAGEELRPGGYLLSADGQSIFILQKDGNVVLYQNFKAVWNSNTDGFPAARLVMQGDGNLVLYDENGKPLWHSVTHGNDGARLELQTDGNLVVYSQDNVQLWYTSTVHNPNLLGYVNTALTSAKFYPGQQLQTANRQYRVILQGDGNLVLYTGGEALWASYTFGDVAYLAMQSDGNLVLYDTAGKPVWHTNTDGRGPSRLVMQADGNLVIYDRSGKPTWHTGTY